MRRFSTTILKEKVFANDIFHSKLWTALQNKRGHFKRDIKIEEITVRAMHFGSNYSDIMMGKILGCGLHAIFIVVSSIAMRFLNQGSATMHDIMLCFTLSSRDWTYSTFSRTLSWRFLTDCWRQQPPGCLRRRTLIGSGRGYIRLCPVTPIWKKIWWIESKLKI